VRPADVGVGVGLVGPAVCVFGTLIAGTVAFGALVGMEVEVVEAVLVAVEVVVVVVVCVLAAGA
jgi:hypothetical protein